MHPLCRNRILSGEPIMITEACRIQPQEALDHLRTSDALLVCAYDDETKFEKNRLDGAISLEELRAKQHWLPKDREIIFYCSCPHDEAATRLAEQYRAKGFQNAEILEGGVKAWTGAGYGMA